MIMRNDQSRNKVYWAQMQSKTFQAMSKIECLLCQLKVPTVEAPISVDADIAHNNKMILRIILLTIMKITDGGESDGNCQRMCNDDDTVFFKECSLVEKFLKKGQKDGEKVCDRTL